LTKVLDLSRGAAAAATGTDGTFVSAFGAVT